ncbi:MAG: kelch repeat-containing protein [Terracidiphilus sp.]
MGGSSTIGSDCSQPVGHIFCGQPGVYGTQAVPAAGNIPGSVHGASSWKDSSGNFWIFGGGGIDASGFEGYLNGLWKFNPSTNEWAWMGGAKTMTCVSGNDGFCAESASLGTLGTFAPSNLPGGRIDASSWIDSSGNLWVFGGTGVNAGGLITGFNDLWELNTSTNEWAWMSGSSGANCTVANASTCSTIPGVYGTQGTPSAANVPGARSGAASWMDNSGHLWLFGGLAFDSTGVQDTLNDLWQFNPATKEWTWMGGSNIGNCRGPGSNYLCDGVYGTLGVAAPGNIPRGRSNAVTWTDGSGHIWLFGGWGYNVENSFLNFNDLWEFNPATNEWKWMSGSSSAFNYCVGINGIQCGQIGVYGTMGTPDAANAPGGRTYSTNWIDSSGNLWLYGGLGLDVRGMFGNLDDLWKFNPSTNQWTWMSGGNVLIYQNGANTIPGVYGTLGTPAAGNVPGGRTQAASWVDNDGRFWLFGGAILLSSPGEDSLNDLWVYQPPASSSNPPGFACHVAYTVNGQWTGGFNAGITIYNTGTAAINAWTLNWSFADGQTVGQWPWNGAFTQNGTDVTVTGMSYNASIPAGGSVSGVGFNGSWNNVANAVPATFAINGTVCQ